MTHPMPIDITNKPDLLRVAEEVRETNNPRVLKRDNEPMAAVVPLRLYEQWEQDRNELLTLMDDAAKTANLSPEEADELTAQAVKAVRAQARAKKSG